jgi:hypothetical protein
MCCDACEKKAVNSFNIRYSNTNIVNHKACKKHYNIAMSKPLTFLKHVRKWEKLNPPETSG